MESNTAAMLMYLKQCAVIEFLTSQKVKPSDSHRCLKTVYGDATVV